MSAFVFLNCYEFETQKFLDQYKIINCFKTIMLSITADENTAKE